MDVASPREAEPKSTERRPVYAEPHMAVSDRRLKRKIDRARRLRGTKAAEETIERAIDAILAEERIERRAGARGWYTPTLRSGQSGASGGVPAR